eukprot:265225-Prymnesium_polylepis.1
MKLRNRSGYGGGSDSSDHPCMCLTLTLLLQTHPVFRRWASHSWSLLSSNTSYIGCRPHEELTNSRPADVTQAGLQPLSAWEVTPPFDRRCFPRRRLFGWSEWLVANVLRERVVRQELLLAQLACCLTANCVDNTDRGLDEPHSRRRRRPAFSGRAAGPTFQKPSLRPKPLFRYLHFGRNGFSEALTSKIPRREEEEALLARSLSASLRQREGAAGGGTLPNFP